MLNDKEIIVYNIVCGNETKKTSIDTKDIEAVIQLVVKSTLSLPSDFDLLPKQP